MTKHLTVEELAAHAAPQPMSRAGKIERWAQLVERYEGPRLVLMHGLEHASRGDLDRCIIHGTHPSAFGLALTDPVLRDAGLTDPSTVGEVMRFFELDQLELHAFSCDCGGAISPSEMALRMRCIASGGGVATHGRAVPGTGGYYAHQARQLQAAMRRAARRFG